MSMHLSETTPGLPILDPQAPLVPLRPGPAARPQPTPPLADVARRDARARLGRGRRRLRHRRRLRRSSQLSRWRILGRRAGGGRLSRRDPEPARLAKRASRGGSSAGRGCSSRISAGNMDSMINHYTANTKVRNDDAYSPGGRIGLRPDRATLAYCQRAREAFPGVPVIAGGVEASRCGGWPITTTGATRSAARSCSTARPTCSSSAWASSRSSRSPAGWPPARRCATCATCAASPIAWAPARRRPTEDTIMLPSFEAGRRPTSWAFAEATQDLHNETNPLNARRLVQYHDRQASSPTRPRLPLGAGRDGPGLRPALHAQAAPELRRAADPGLRDGQGLGADHARLLRRLHVLLDHGPPGPDHPSRSRRSRSWARSARWRPTRTSRAWSATSAGRRPTCTRCAARGPRSRRSAGGCPASIPTICKLLGTDHGPLVELMQAGPRGAGRQEGARRLRHPHGPGPPQPRVHARAGRAPRRRPSEGRARAHRPERARR